jgi:hypothetical protein
MGRGDKVPSLRDLNRTGLTGPEGETNHACENRIATVLLPIALGLAACDQPTSRPLPSAPSAVPQPIPQPTPNLEGYTLTASSDIVSPGGELNVSWTAPTGGQWDWIGIFTAGAPTCDPDWYEYTKGSISGTLTFKAPGHPGQDEFRYYLNDGCVETVRSSPVTVTPS